MTSQLRHDSTYFSRRHQMEASDLRYYLWNPLDVTLGGLECRLDATQEPDYPVLDPCLSNSSIKQLSFEPYNV
jgi:hypothetical protein